MNFSRLVTLIRKNLWTFVIVGIVAVAAAAIFSGPTFMQPEFKSVAVVYPVNIEPLSEESESEQLLQLFQASEIRDSIISKYNLTERYEIDTTETGWKFKVNREYLDHVVVSKTIYESVRLEVFDHDPEIAHKIATDVLYYVNEVANRLHTKSAREHMIAYEKQIENQSAMIDSMRTAIAQFGAEKEVVHFASQSREMMRGYFNALIERGASDRVLNQVKDVMKAVEANGPVYNSMVRMHDLMQNQFYKLYEEYSEVKKEAEQEIAYTITVVDPDIPDKKVWPVRWLIVAISLIGAILATLVILLITRQRDYRKE